MLSGGEMIQRRNMDHTASGSMRLGVYFLIANARLECRLSHRKDSLLKISNRNGSRFLISLRNRASEFVLPLITWHLSLGP